MHPVSSALAILLSNQSPIFSIAKLQSRPQSWRHVSDVKIQMSAWTTLRMKNEGIKLRLAGRTRPRLANTSSGAPSLGCDYDWPWRPTGNAEYPSWPNWMDAQQAEPPLFRLRIMLQWEIARFVNIVWSGRWPLHDTLEKPISSGGISTKWYNSNTKH